MRRFDPDPRLHNFNSLEALQSGGPLRFHEKWDLPPPLALPARIVDEGANQNDAKMCRWTGATLSTLGSAISRIDQCVSVSPWLAP
jgi:hypothetical protein